MTTDLQAAREWMKKKLRFEEHENPDITMASFSADELVECAEYILSRRSIELNTDYGIHFNNPPRFDNMIYGPGDDDYGRKPSMAAIDFTGLSEEMVDKIMEKVFESADPKGYRATVIDVSNLRNSLKQLT